MARVARTDFREIFSREHEGGSLLADVPERVVRGTLWIGTLNQSSRAI
jgi:hypothetical protein